MDLPGKSRLGKNEQSIVKENDMAKKEEKRLIATVIGDRPLNIRSGRTTETNNVIGELQPGTEIEILKDGKLWCRIEQGYIMRKFLTF